ncbi:hypothetical protein C0992_012787 [Termitomyces sp. T32_za158]|nr:hypothetical protein C0992_012787 [Termitomyces sp. T32_za158]
MAAGRSRLMRVIAAPQDQHYPHNSHSDLQLLSQSFTSSESPSEQYSSSASGGTIRKDYPVTLSTSTTLAVKKVKIEKSSGSCGRAKVGDYDMMTRAILESSISHFHVFIVTNKPFLDNTMNFKPASDAWVASCYKHGVQMEFPEEIQKLASFIFNSDNIVGHASQVRGQMKTVAWLVVPALFGIKTSLTINAKKDSENCAGFPLHPVFQDVLNKTWFKNKADEGLTHIEFSDGGIPLITIALIATVVECCLDDFEAKTCEANIIPRLQQHMLKKARKHAKVEEGTRMMKRMLKLEDADIEAAKKEWENLVLSEDEDE